jgi:ribosomal protein L21E
MWIPDRFQAVQDTGSIAWLQIFSLGEVVKLTGQPSVFRDSMQIDFQPGCIGSVQEMDMSQYICRLRLSKDDYIQILTSPVVISSSGPNYLERCRDPNAETLFRLRVLNQEREVYTKPLELPDFILQEVKVALCSTLSSWIIFLGVFKRGFYQSRLTRFNGLLCG